MIKRKMILKAITLSLLTILSGCFNNLTYIVGGEDKKGFVDGFAKDAKLKNPSKMAVDEETGNLYVVDQDNTAIRKITADGKVSTIFDTSKYQGDFDTKYKSTITEIRVNKDYLYFSTNTFISRIKLNDGGYEKFLGTGEFKRNSSDPFFKQESKFTDTSFSQIKSFCFDDNENLFILDRDRVKKADINTKIVSDIFLGLGQDVSGFYDFMNGYSISMSKNIINDIEFNIITKDIYLIVQIFDNLRLYKKSTAIYGDFIRIPIDSKAIQDVYTDKKGNIYVIALDKTFIFRLDKNMNVNRIYSKEGISDDLYESTYLSIDNKRNIMYLSEDNKIFKIDLDK